MLTVLCQFTESICTLLMCMFKSSFSAILLSYIYLEVFFSVLNILKGTFL